MVLLQPLWPAHCWHPPLQCTQAASRQRPVVAAAAGAVPPPGRPRDSELPDPETLAGWVATTISRGGDIENLDPKTGITLLTAVAKCGAARTAQDLLAAGANAEAKTFGGITVLMNGATNTVDPGMVSALLAAGLGSQLEVTDFQGSTALMYAAGCGNAAGVQALLAAGANVAAFDNNHKTAFSKAVEADFNHLEVVELLLAAGADPNVAHSVGGTPVLVAAYLWRPAVIARLAAAGADLEAKNGAECTPLEAPCAQSHDSRVLGLRAAGPGVAATVEALLAAGATPTADALFMALQARQQGAALVLLQAGAPREAVTDEGYAPIHVAVSTGCTEVLQALLEAGVSPDARGTRLSLEATPLITAAAVRHLEAAELLLAAGASPSLASCIGATPLMVAAAGGHVEMVELLAQKGADVAATDRRGCTALHWAGEEGSLKGVQALLQLRADPLAEDKEGQTALVVAARRGHTAVLCPLIEAEVSTLLARGGDIDQLDSQAGFTLLMWAAMYGRAETVRALLAAGANAWAKSRDGRTVLACGAINSVDPEMVATLLAAGLGDQVQCADFSGVTPLMCAAQYGSAASVRALLQAGGDVAAIDRQRRNVLFWALEREDSEVEVLQLLLAAGDDPNVTDSVGCTPLVMASHYWRPGAVALLVGAGADVQAKHSSGYTALTFVCLPSQSPEGGALRAAGPGAVATVEALLAAGATPTAEAVIMALKHQPEAADALLRAGETQ